MKTLKDLPIDFVDTKWISGEAIESRETVPIEDLRKEAIIILKQNKEINTADWIEFFNIEEEFADAVLGVEE